MYSIKRKYTNKLINSIYLGSVRRNNYPAALSTNAQAILL